MKPMNSERRKEKKIREYRGERLREPFAAFDSIPAQIHATVANTPTRQRTCQTVRPLLHINIEYYHPVPSPTC